MKIKLKDLIAILIIICLFIFILKGIFKQAFNQFEIKSNNAKTVGIVYNLKISTRSCILHYKYLVDKDTLFGAVGINPSKCDFLRENCLNRKFYVYYSLKSPKKSLINLGKYNEEKKTVEFFKPY
ncbi:hypothetical protein SY27_17350 [Flavobacterium sp. 316]|uniref:hypothetical protein n=1 Tax=Flavobacterium sp. 316 TaxID=1603293 RepID=UPI0005E82663|nr:hypothetical protein [Flavobacterium sp. 316]KIX19816.1 hypothetical protein SY27_17350 [Flavobacterium sp. 316]